MGKKGGNPPAPPDPYETASTESGFNRLDTYSPSGSGVRYGYTGADGTFQPGIAPEGSQSAVTAIESDTERQLRELLEPASLSLTGRIVEDNIEGMPDAARVGDRGTVAQDIFDRNFSLMSPAIERSQSRLLNNLQARGMPVGGEAFNEAYGNQQRETEGTISRLAQDANIAAGQEQSRQFGLDSAQRGSAIAELVAAMGGGYNPPGGAPSGTAPGVNYGGLVNSSYDQQLNAYNQSQANANASMGALGSLGGAMLMKCTISAKDVQAPINTVTAADVISKLGLYAWRYKDGEQPDGDGGALHVGPMAEEFHALTGLGDDKTINVIDIIGVLAGAVQKLSHDLQSMSHSHHVLLTEMAKREALNEARERKMIEGRLDA